MAGLIARSEHGRLARSIGIAALLFSMPMTAHAAEVLRFSPEGAVADVQQVRATFDAPMVTLGDTSAADPFTISCALSGNGHWVDPSTWVWDVHPTDTDGPMCAFTLHADLRSLDGAAVTGAREFRFSLPPLTYNQRLKIAFIAPAPNSAIREDQRFLVAFDRPLKTPLPQFSCEVDAGARQPAIPLSYAEQRLLEGTSLSGSDQKIGLRCPRSFAESSRVRLILERGPGRELATSYMVRGPIAAQVVCRRIETGGNCLPSQAINVGFSAELSKEFLDQIRLDTSDGPVTGQSSVYKANFFYPGSSSISFAPPLQPNTSYKIRYPAHMVDVEGRPVDPGLLPQTIATSKALPIVGFFAERINIVRYSDHASIRLVARDHPASTWISEVVVGNEADQDAADKRLLCWLQRLSAPDRTTADLDQSGCGEPPVIPVKKDAAATLTLKEPGLHVFTTAQLLPTQNADSETLAAQIAAGAETQRVGAIATRMSVIFKTSKENGAVWITNLDDTGPVADVKLRVFNAASRLIWQGSTDRDGFALIPRSFGSRLSTVIARKTDSQGRHDIAVTRGDWDSAIESQSDPEAFAAPNLFDAAQVFADSVMDRSLVKRGETVSMRTVIRAATSSGFALVGQDRLPSVMRISPYASNRHWDMPLVWDRDHDALSSFEVPADAPLGNYSVTLRAPDGKSEYRSGSFRVEAYRLPTMTGSIDAGPEPLLVDSIPKIDLDLHFQDGGAAGGTPVRVTAALSPVFTGYATPPGFDESANLSAPYYGTWLAKDSALIAFGEQDLKLDSNGKGTVVLPTLPDFDRDYSLCLELTYPDANGEIQTISKTFTVRHSRLRVALSLVGRVKKNRTIELQVKTLDPAGNVRPFEPIRIEAAMVKNSLPDSLRTSLGIICTTVTDANGFASCRMHLDDPAFYSFEAIGTDEHGLEVTTEMTRFTQPERDEMKDLLVTADKPLYVPGEVAHLDVESPLPKSRAWLAVEREGLIASRFIDLHAGHNRINIDVPASYAPNIYVSLIAVPPGRDGPDEALPIHAAGAIMLKVEPVGNTLIATVSSDRVQYAPHETAGIKIIVRNADGSALQRPMRATLAVIDEALLDLHDNESWQLLDRMLRERPLSVVTSTPLAFTLPTDPQLTLLNLERALVFRLQREEMRDASSYQFFGNIGDESIERVTVTGSNLPRVAAPPLLQPDTPTESRQEAGETPVVRRILSSLLAWQPDVALDDRGEALVRIPIADSLSRFRVVVVASSGEGRFGTGSSSFVVSKDVQITSGLAPVVRVGDRLKERVTIRNRSAQPVDLQMSASSEQLGSALETQSIHLDASESKEVGWIIDVPPTIQALSLMVTALDTLHPENEDRLAIEQRVDPVTPVEIRAATLAQAAPTIDVAVAAPPGSIRDTARVEVSLEARLAGDLPGVTNWMQAYPNNCIEQRISIALATQDLNALHASFADLPKYLDEDGLANYFPTGADTRHLGSDILTSYLLRITKAYGIPLPQNETTRMTLGLQRFVQGKIERSFWAARPDLLARRLAAVAALSQYSAATPAMLDNIHVSVDDWTTAMLLDWLDIVHAVPLAAQGALTDESVSRQLQARVTFQGRRAVISTERRDEWFWLMENGDVDAARLLIAVMDRPEWQAQVPQLAAGLLARQNKGAWQTTVANAWGKVAISHFSQSFETGKVSGTSNVSLGELTTPVLIEGHETTPTKIVQYPLTQNNQTLRVSHTGMGAPWATISVFATVPVTAPRFSGYRIDKTMSPVRQKSKDQISVGDTYRVQLAIDADSDSTWVAVRDPVPSGATILGNGLGRDSKAATATERPSSITSPSYVERDVTSYRSYYRFMPRGKLTLEYTIRIDNPGTFQLPPTRVEAMYAPDVFGELPNAPVTIVP